MNQTDLTLKLSKKFGLPKYFSEKVIKFLLFSICSELKKGKRVRLRNFGTFERRISHKKLRPKFNPSKNMLE